LLWLHLGLAGSHSKSLDNLSTRPSPVEAETQLKINSGTLVQHGVVGWGGGVLPQRTGVCVRRHCDHGVVSVRGGGGGGIREGEMSGEFCTLLFCTFLRPVSFCYVSEGDISKLKVLVTICR
jgi:hypothetical protein